MKKLEEMWKGMNPRLMLYKGAITTQLLHSPDAQK